MKPIDNDFERQFSRILTRSTHYVADMHMLSNPNQSAIALNSKLKVEGLSDQELINLYENCEDPLIKALEAIPNSDSDEFQLVLSLGGLVVNGLDLITSGLDDFALRSTASRARELGVPQHVYIAQKILEITQNLDNPPLTMEHLTSKYLFEEYARRTNILTGLRFKALEDLISRRPDLRFVHMNGYADVMSSLISEKALPSEASPMQIFESSAALSRYYKQTPGFLLTCTSCYGGEWDDLYYGTGNLDLLVPYSLDFGAINEKLVELNKESFAFMGTSHGSDIRMGALFIPEALDTDIFPGIQTPEGMAVYETAMQMWPIKSVIHGRTRDPCFVKYRHNDKPVVQIAPNTLATWNQIDYSNLFLRR